MTDWTHVGRLWTSGEPYLAMDSVLLPRWRGCSDDAYNELIVPLPPSESTVLIGGSAAAVVGADGTEGWLEVFVAGDKRLAVVQTSGSSIVETLAYAEDDDLDGGIISVTKGYLVLLNASMDGTGEFSGELIEPSAPMPSGEPDPGGMLLQMRPGDYRLRVRWRTELADGSSFARWLLG